MQFSDLTKYSKIYKNTYWGLFSSENRSESELEELKTVIENRNKFINDFGIKNICKKPVKLAIYIRHLANTNMIDHLEVYRTKDKKYLLLNSPYHPDENRVPDMEKIYKMYNNAYSYVKIISKDELKI